MYLNLASIVFDSANNWPEAPAVLSECGWMTHAELSSAVREKAEMLSDLGIVPGDRVALMANNGLHFTVAYFAVLALGAIVVPINVLLTSGEAAGLMGHAQVRAVVSDALRARVASEAIALMGRENVLHAEISAEDAVSIMRRGKAKDTGPFCAETSPEDTAVIFYTSGTTGSPKGAELTHVNLYANARWVSECSLEDDSGETPHWGPGTVAMAVLPLSHSFGQTCMQNAPLLNGGAVCYCQRFDAPRLATLLEAYRVTVMATVPRMIRDLLLVPNLSTCDLSAFRYCLVGGAAIDPKQVADFEDRFGVEVLEGYGLSETSPVVAFRTPRTPRRPGSVGRPIGGLEVRVVDDLGQELPRGQVGELVVRGHAVMKGYYGNPKATADVMRNGWFHTGDMCAMDDRDLIYVVDRKKDVIIRNGFTVYPAEVEAVVATYPGVREAAVIGVPDSVCGEEVKAIVVADEKDAGALVEFCRARLARFKYPRLVEFRDALPRGIKGQLLRRKLR